MYNDQTSLPGRIAQLVMRFSLSAFVIASFVMYIAYDHHISQKNDVLGQLSVAVADPATQVSAFSTPKPTATPLKQQTSSSTSLTTSSVITAGPTATQKPPTPTDLPNRVYNDGEFVGDRVNAYYGIVQVKAVIQNDQITDVQFLDYPTDRRVSQRINSVAVPYLTQEALRAQTSRVNIVSGATLTSLAFMQSLQSALTDAKS